MDQASYNEWVASFNGFNSPVVGTTPDPRIQFDIPLPDPTSTRKGWTTDFSGLPVAAPIPEPTEDECEEGLSVKQTKAVQCLLQGYNQQKTGEAVGVTRRTVCDWVKLPAFKKVLRRYRKEGLAASMSLLQSESLELATTLVTLAKNPLVDPADRIRASVSALKMAQEQAFNENIAERLDAIESSNNAGSTDGSTFSVVTRADES